MAMASIFTVMLSLFGCGVKATPEDITSVSVGCYSGMNRYSYYSFELALVDDEVLFSCHYYYYTKDAAHEEVTLEDVPVDAEYMAKMREMVEEHGFLDMKPKEPKVFVHDAQIYALELQWPVQKRGRTVSESLRMTGYSPVSGADDVEKFLREIAAALQGEPEQT